MLLWDVSLAFPLLPFSSNCTENCYCANSYTIDTFAHTYYESEKGLNFFKAHTLKVLFLTAVFSTPLLTSSDFEAGVEILTATVDCGNRFYYTVRRSLVFQFRFVLTC